MLQRIIDRSKSGPAPLSKKAARARPAPRSGWARRSRAGAQMVLALLISLFQPRKHHGSVSIPTQNPIANGLARFVHARRGISDAPCDRRITPTGVHRRVGLPPSGRRRHRGVDALPYSGPQRRIGRRADTCEIGRLGSPPRRDRSPDIGTAPGSSVGDASARAGEDSNSGRAPELRRRPMSASGRSYDRSAPSIRRYLARFDCHGRADD
jgi:hypothetical protein